MDSFQFNFIWRGKYKNQKEFPTKRSQYFCEKGWSRSGVADVHTGLGHLVLLESREAVQPLGYVSWRPSWKCLPLAVGDLSIRKITNCN